MSDWTDQPQPDLEATIAAFKTEFPGWWYSVGECQVSCDASCAPTRESPDIYRVAHDDRFNSGFHCDLPQPSILADALRAVMAEAVIARRIASRRTGRAMTTLAKIANDAGL